jgi:hypothetical protein
MHSTYPAHLILLDLITCYEVLHYAVFSNLLYFILFGPNILLSTLFSDTLSLVFFLLFLVGWDWVHLVLRPLLAYCTSPRWQMMEIVEKLVEWRLAGETEVLGENLPQRHFVHYKSHMTLTWARTRAAALGSQRLIAWAMARHNPQSLFLP